MIEAQFCLYVGILTHLRDEGRDPSDSKGIAPEKRSSWSVLRAMVSRAGRPENNVETWVEVILEGRWTDLTVR